MMGVYAALALICFSLHLTIYETNCRRYPHGPPHAPEYPPQAQRFPPGYHPNFHPQSHPVPPGQVPNQWGHSAGPPQQVPPNGQYPYPQDLQHQGSNINPNSVVDQGPDDIPFGKEIKTDLSPEGQEQVLEKVNEWVPEIVDAIVEREMILDGLLSDRIDEDFDQNINGAATYDNANAATFKSPQVVLVYINLLFLFFIMV